MLALASLWESEILVLPGRVCLLNPNFKLSALSILGALLVGTISPVLSHLLLELSVSCVIRPLKKIPTAWLYRPMSH